jgi:hypothetical protein
MAHPLPLKLRNFGTFRTATHDHTPIFPTLERLRETLSGSRNARQSEARTCAGDFAPDICTKSSFGSTAHRIPRTGRKTRETATLAGIRRVVIDQLSGAPKIIHDWHRDVTKDHGPTHGNHAARVLRAVPGLRRS